MRFVLDAGALIALERGDRRMWTRFKAAFVDESELVTHGGVVGQVWRGGGPKQARLARALAGVDVKPLDGSLGRVAGSLLMSIHGEDVNDAAIVAMARTGDVLFTSDPDDLELLVRASNKDIELVAV